MKKLYFYLILLSLTSCSRINISEIDKKEECIKNLSSYVKAEQVQVIPAIDNLYEQVLISNNGIITNSETSNFVFLLEKAKEFFSDPEPILRMIGEEEKGLEKLELIQALIMNDKTEEEISSLFEKVDPVMKTEYDTAMLITNSNNTIPTNVIIENVYDKYYTKSYFGISYNQPSVNRYSVLCATALGGEILYVFSPWCFWWLKAIGIGVFVGSYSGMGMHVYDWNDTFEKWRSGRVYVIPGSEIGKTVQAVLSTAVPTTFGYIWMRAEINLVISLYQTVAAQIDKFIFLINTPVIGSLYIEKWYIQGNSAYIVLRY
jgi:hypothetical protein